MSVQRVSEGDFVRQWAVEGRRIAWLLGAGASVSAGVPSAQHVIEELLAGHFASTHGLELQQLDMADTRTKERVLTYYDGQHGMPERGAVDEYSAAFQLALPESAPRRQYIRSKLENRHPNHGHKVLGALLTQGLADVVLSTNFDDLIEQAADRARAVVDKPERSRLRVVGLAGTGPALTALSDDRFPLLVKLHGDFAEDDLKNIEPELREQDEQLRHAFMNASQRFGVAVIGYSGRDQSVLDMLRDAADAEKAYPAGFWWLNRGSGPLWAPVTELLNALDERGVTTRIVEIDNYDETMAGLPQMMGTRWPGYGL